MTYFFWISAYCKHRLGFRLAASELTVKRHVLILNNIYYTPGYNKLTVASVTPSYYSIFKIAVITLPCTT